MDNKHIGTKISKNIVTSPSPVVPSVSSQNTAQEYSGNFLSLLTVQLNESKTEFIRKITAYEADHSVWG